MGKYGEEKCQIIYRKENVKEENVDVNDTGHCNKRC
jgi:hypothetical protein